MILRETQSQNDADDANDAESGIWYRDILKTASQASSASLSSRKNCAGGLGYTPEMCMWMTTCYASKTCSRSKRRVIKADTHTNSYMLQSESLLIHPKFLTRKSESVLIHFPKCCYYGSASLEYGTHYDDGKRMISERYLP